MNNPRSKESHSRIGDTSLDYAYDAASSAFRMQGPILGKVLILGALNAGAKPSKLGALIAVYLASGYNPQDVIHATLGVKGSKLKGTLNLFRDQEF